MYNNCYIEEVTIGNEFRAPTLECPNPTSSFAVLRKETFLATSCSLKFRSFLQSKTNTLVWGLGIPVVKRSRKWRQELPRSVGHHRVTLVLSLQGLAHLLPFPATTCWLVAEVPLFS